jgi:hypothetical protein
VRAAGGRGRLLVYDADTRGERIKATSKTLKEAEREYGWAVITGVVGHKAIRESVNRSRSGDPDSGSFYRRVDLERQTLNRDGSWSSWIAVDPTPTIGVLQNIPEEEKELIGYLLLGLVDPLPHLMNGKWQGVNVERMVKQIPIAAQIPPEGQLQGQLRGRIPPLSNSMTGPGIPPVRDALPPELMLRCFDFSVSPGQTYRYRARIVVDARPKLSRLKEVLGVWSRPTDAVVVP